MGNIRGKKSFTAAAGDGSVYYVDEATPAPKAATPAEATQEKTKQKPISHSSDPYEGLGAEGYWNKYGEGSGVSYRDWMADPDPAVLKKVTPATTATPVEATQEKTETPTDPLEAAINEMYEQRKALQAEDETAKKRQRAMSAIAGVSDGLSALANLIGVSKGASNIKLGDNVTPLQKKFEDARKERKADIKSISDRLEQMLRDQAELKYRKDRDTAEQQRWETTYNYNVARDAKQDEKDAAKLAWDQEKWDDEFGLRKTQVDAELKLAERRLKETERHNKMAERQAAATYSLQLKKLQQAAETSNAYPIQLGPDETLMVPKTMLTNGKIDPIWNSLSQEEKYLAMGKEALLAGKVPSLEAKIGVIATVAHTNEAVAEKMRKAFPQATSSAGKGKKANPMS